MCHSYCYLKFQKIQKNCGVELNQHTRIGYGLRLPHRGGIVIHPQAVIGNNCEIMQGVTIGNNILKSRDDVAVIGDEVLLCTGAKIIGGVHIGNTVVVGANAVVTKDIPNHTVVAGIPAKEIRTCDDRFVINRYEEKNEKEQEKIKLPNVTLAAMTSVSVYETVKALEYSMRGIEFGEVVFITHKKPWYLPKTIKYKHIDRLTNIDDFNYNIAYNLCDYIDTDYVLLVHHDGFVIHPENGGMNSLIMIILVRRGRFLQMGKCTAFMIFMETGFALVTAWEFEASSCWSSQEKQIWNGQEMKKAYIMRIFLSVVGTSMKLRLQE